ISQRTLHVVYYIHESTVRTIRGLYCCVRRTITRAGRENKVADLSIDFAGMRFKNPIIVASATPSKDAKYMRKLSLIHISEPTRLRRISYAVFCLKKKKNKKQQKKNNTT